MSKAFYALGRLKAGERNKTEAKYEAYLEKQKLAGEVLSYCFEPLHLRLADKTFYKPDFLVLNKACEVEFHEVKGSRYIFQDDAKVKVKVAAKLFPYFRFRVAYPQKGGTWEMEEY